MLTNNYYITGPKDAFVPGHTDSFAIVVLDFDFFSCHNIISLFENTKSEIMLLH